MDILLIQTLVLYSRVKTTDCPSSPPTYYWQQNSVQ